MNSIQSLRRHLCVLMLAFGAFCAPVKGQAIANLHAEALTEMKAGNWPGAHTLLVRATDNFDARAPQLFGPRFGWFWYHRGYAEIKLGKYEDAMKSFKQCYEKYANVAAKKGQAPSMNLYHKKALLLWGHAAKGAEEWDTSIRMYKKFLKERDPTRDSYEKGVFYINMAINHFKLKKIKEGSEFLETAIKGKVTFPTPNKGIMAAFNDMVAAVIEKKDEASLLDFITKNRAHIKLEPFEAHEFSQLFMKLAQDAKASEMFRATFELYALVPSTIAAIDDIKSRLAMVGTYPRTIKDGSMIVKKEDLEASLLDLQNADKAGKVNEVYAFLNTAVMHEEDGNTRGAFAVYEQLELYFPKAKIFRDKKLVPAREGNLYNLVRTSAVIGEVLTTEHYGSIFLKDFPQSSHVDEVRRMMLTSLFFNGEYEKCIEVAERMIDNLSKPSKQHDICLFVLGGSKHYTAAFVEAQPLLDEYIETYDGKDADKIRLQATLYFQAANRSRLQEWTKSASLLDAFLKKYPDPKSNLYLPFALYDRANCYYAESENDPAFDNVTRIEEEFPGVAIMESNYALKGNILESLSKPDEAETYYKKALELAETKKNDLVAGECLFYLTALVGKEKIGKTENPRVAEAVPYYNKFWDQYGSDSPFKAKVAVAGIPGMAKIGKLDEALERLQGVIADIAKSPGTPGLEEAIGSYTDAYLKSHTPTELKEHYYAFPQIDSRDKATRALLRIAIIDVFEGVLESADKENDEKLVINAKAMIEVLFNELRTEFEPKDLSNFILVKVGDFIRKKTSSPAIAKPYYEEALNRPDDQTHKYRAIFGLADVLGRGTSDDQKRAIDLLTRVVADSDDDADKEDALYLIASLHSDRGDYDAAIKTANEYINTPSYRRKKLEARMLLGATYDKSGKKEDAMGVYAQIWGTSMGAIRYSAPAIKRWMEIVWDRNGNNPNGKSDRQFAYEKGAEYLKLTVNAVKKASQEEVVVYNQVKELVADYESRSDTTKVEEEE
ncbi:tetratricopeptide repeat protein [Verrucomicrobiaceae bacterium 227]